MVSYHRAGGERLTCKKMENEGLDFCKIGVNKGEEPCLSMHRLTMQSRKFNTFLIVINMDFQFRNVDNSSTFGSFVIGAADDVQRMIVVN